MAGFGGKSLFQVKKLFFDRPVIDRTMSKSQLAFLSQAGAFVRRTAQTSIRKTKGKSSAPGEPPRGHGKQLLKKNIFFGIDKSAKDPDCLVGPVSLNQVDFGKDRQPVKGTVPSVLEHGGAIWIREVFRFGKWRRVDGRRRKDTYAGLPIRYRKVEIAARPFMLPALIVNKPKFPGMWRGLFKK